MSENKTNNQLNTTNELIAWNPLEQSDDALSQAQQKRLIRNILKSYTGYYDFLSEPLQNALDATANFQYRNSDQSYHPKIWIRISLRESYISITDIRTHTANASIKTKFRGNFSIIRLTFKSRPTSSNRGKYN
jgi:hypothetical protein